MSKQNNMSKQNSRSRRRRRRRPYAAGNDLRMRWVPSFGLNTYLHLRGASVRAPGQGALRRVTNRPYRRLFHTHLFAAHFTRPLFSATGQPPCSELLSTLPFGSKLYHSTTAPASGWILSPTSQLHMSRGYDAGGRRVESGGARGRGRRRNRDAGSAFEGTRWRGTNGARG